MKLSEPLRVGRRTLANRIMFPPLTTGYENQDGSASAQSIAFYERLARGGAAYLVLGDLCPINSFSPTPKLYSDELIPGYRKLTDSVHAAGALMGAQIFYPEYDVPGIGRLLAQRDMAAVRAKLHHDMEHFASEVPAAELDHILTLMADCAARAQKAGFDFVQIHGDRLNGALCSTLLNRRTDQYGGSFENRTRFALELVRRIRAAAPGLGIDYKLSVRTAERGRGGVTREEAPTFAALLAAAGVEMLHVAQANHTGNLADTIPPMGVQPYAFFAEIAAEVKQAVAIPVSTAGRIFTPAAAESLLVSGKADLIALGRPLLADPDWPRKALAGRADDIRCCICCNRGCTDHIQNRQFLSCVLNAENGFEQTRAIRPAEIPKHVVVVGGGPAGLEAARVAAARGHRVTLFEREPHLGGQLLLAAVPPRKAEMLRALRYLEHAVCRPGITLRLGEAADADKILALQPDAVLVAAGAENFRLPVPGADLPTVLDAWDVLAGTAQPCGRVCVIGGGLVGAETAELLADAGHPVTIVEMADAIAAAESTTVLPTMTADFDARGVLRLTGQKVTAITPKEVCCADRDGRETRIACDCTVMAVGARPAAFDTAPLEAAGIACRRIGDCEKKAADLANAVHSGYQAACEL